MNGSLRRIRRLLSLEKPSVGPRPTQPTHASPQTPGERTMNLHHTQFGPRQSF